MISKNPQIVIRHNLSRQRFEARVDARLAYLSYTPNGDRVSFDHTYVPDELRGQGVAAVLVRAALNEARERHWKIVPRCTYVVRFVERNPEFADLVVPQTRA